MNRETSPLLSLAEKTELFRRARGTQILFSRGVGLGSSVSFMKKKDFSLFSKKYNPAMKGLVNTHART